VSDAGGGRVRADERASLTYRVAIYCDRVRAEGSLLKQLRGRMKFPLVLVVASSGCLFHVPVNLDESWASPLDDDLRLAVDAARTEFPTLGWNIQIKWAGARGSIYAIKRGITGEPIRESASVVYGYTLPSAPGTCYLLPAGASMVRENLGGGSFAPPHIVSLQPVRPDGSSTGDTVSCSALDKARGGVHVAANSGQATAHPHAHE
jgi:hypothetical protein